MAGDCTTIDVTLLADGGCRVVDNGRGIPVDPHPEYKGKSARRGRAHDAARRRQVRRRAATRSPVACTASACRWSTRCRAGSISRSTSDGGKFEQHYVEGRQAAGQARARRRRRRKRGTTITFWPDATIFEETEFRAQTMLEHVREMAFLNKGLEIRFHDERGRSRHRPVVQVRRAASSTSSSTSTRRRSRCSSGSSSSSDTGENHDVDIAMQWNTGYYEGIHSFANNIATTEGGMHEEGFKKALTNVVNRYAKGKGLLKDKDDNLLGEDIREGLTAIISVKLPNPQFEGQTKTKLGNTEMRSFVEKVTNEKLADWLEEHPTEARRPSARPRRPRTPGWRRARPATSRGASRCSSRRRCRASSPTAASRNPDESELFIVEGDSAGGSAKQARDPRTQAILPIRGKILNVERARLDKMLKNEEIQALISAIGSGIGDEFDLEKLRYHKIVIMADADVDGSHIRTLLLTFFYRQLTEIVKHEHIYIAQPPLFRADIGKERTYLKDEAALARVRSDAREPQDQDQPLQGSRRDGLAGARRDHHEPGHAHAPPGVGGGSRHRRRGLLQAHGRRRRGSARHSSRQNAKDVRFLDM